MIYAMLGSKEKRCAFMVRALTVEEIVDYVSTVDGCNMLDVLEWNLIDVGNENGTLEGLGKMKGDNHES